MRETLASIRGVCKSFPPSATPALADISGELRAGEIRGLVGADSDNTAAQSVGWVKGIDWVR